jgi:SAM-dependent methyltransferase
MRKQRLHNRVLKLWRNDYLHYRYLWPNIEWAANSSCRAVRTSSPVVLDIGCGHQPYRDLFPATRYIGMDWTVTDTSPNLVASSLCLPIKDRSIDIVLATQVIEHVTNPGLMVQECKRVLRPGGYLILSGPFYWPLHEEPHDYFRFTKYGFAQLLYQAGFSNWQIREDGGDWAQIMLSVSLRLNGKLLGPMRCMVNVAGLVLDGMTTSRQSPANYTVIALA